MIQGKSLLTELLQSNMQRGDGSTAGSGRGKKRDFKPCSLYSSFNLSLSSALWNGCAQYLSQNFSLPVLGFCPGWSWDRHSCQQPQAASAFSTNSLVLVVHHLDLQRWHSFQSIHKLGRITKRQGFGVLLQWIAPLLSWPGEDKTNFSLCHGTRTQTVQQWRHQLRTAQQIKHKSFALSAHTASHQPQVLPT